MISNSFSLSQSDWLINFDESSHHRLGLNWDSPTLVVSDVHKAIQFYEKVFGFVPVFILPDQDNQVTFARLRYRGTHFILTTDRDHNTDDTQSFFYLYVDDVDRVLACAVEQGARSMELPHTDFLGDHKARLRDIFGYVWDLASTSQF